jgi:hypothetical protein
MPCRRVYLAADRTDSAVVFVYAGSEDEDQRPHTEAAGARPKHGEGK